MKIVLLTFDVEEFDLPREIGKPLEKEKEFEVSKKGLLSLIDLLNKHDIKATFFTTSNFAEKYPHLIRILHKKGHEIASHGYCHLDSYSSNLYKIQLSKNKIEKIMRSKIKGFRAPRFEIKNISELSNLGFVYDSSIHPTWVPGRYFNLFRKRKIHNIGRIIEIPPSVLPVIRLPISWIFFRNLGIFYSKLFARLNFVLSGYLMILFHSWEFYDLKNFDLPFYIKKNSGEKLIKMLEKYIIFCKKNNYQFEIISNYLEKSFK